MKKRIRINGFIIFFSVLLLAIFPGRFLRLEYSSLEAPYKIIGMALVLFGLLLRVSSRGFKAEQSQNGHTLVIGGPYALVRNPMYLGICAIALGAILLFFQWWVLLVFLLFFTARYATLILKEEKLLLERFGEEYARYQAKTPRLLPRPRALFQKGALPLKLRWIKKEISSIIILITVSLSLEAVIEVTSFSGVFPSPCFLGVVAIVVLFLVLARNLSRRYENISRTG